MKQKDFLLEIGTAELPPKQIDGLVSMLARNIEKNLNDLSIPFKTTKTFSSPRRLAVLISDLPDKQPDQPQELRGPNIEIAFDKSGQPTKAAIKFAESCDTTVSELGRIEDKKGVYLFHRSIKTGKPITELLPSAIIDSIKKIHAKRAMHWGEKIGPFVRPVYWILALFDETVLPVEIFGINSSNKTFGHRFHHPKEITVSKPNSYEKLLLEKGFVVVDREKRKQKIIELVAEATKGYHAPTPEDLLEEITDIVEWPIALVGKFDERFLRIPQEALITTMQTHQRCFSTFDNSGKLMPHFVMVSNIESKNPKQVIAGNEKVIKARLSDADYFYQLDLKQNFVNNIEKLKEMAFQEKLGSMYDKTARLQALVPFVAEKIHADQERAKKAATLSKCDLVTSMVWEFPELQGVMGYYYAKTEQDEETAIAIKEQYLPRFAKDGIPTTKLGCALALADKIDSLVGFFAVTKNLSSDKDPLGMRRMATGIVRILLEKTFFLELKETIERSISLYKFLPKENGFSAEKILDFIFDRLHHIYLEQNKNPTVFRAVLASRPTSITDFAQRFEAVEVFSSDEESQDLVEIYKRIKNILEKSKTDKAIFDPLLATEEGEKSLAEAVLAAQKSTFTLYQNKEYLMLLKELTKLKPTLEQFFEKVIVMDENETIRNNRLALLRNLYELFALVADLSYLVSGNASS